MENKYTCKYSIKSELNERYELLYDNIYIDSFSFITDFLYEVNHNVKKKKKKKYTILTKNDVGTIISEIIVGNSKNSEIIKYNENNIIYEINSASVEVAANQGINEIYLKSFRLKNNENEITVKPEEQYHYEFNKVSKVEPKYLFSSKDFDNVYFSVTSEFKTIYLINGETKINAGNRNNYFVSNIEFGLNYIVNYYNNPDTVLHTIKYGFEKKCQSTITKNNIIFNLYNEKGDLDISNDFNVQIKDKSNDHIINVNIEKKSVKEEGSIYVYLFEIDYTNLNEGEYYIEINNVKLQNDILTIIKGKPIKNIIGDLYTDVKEQNFIVEFYENLNDEEIIYNIIIYNDSNFKILAFCDLLFDNRKAFICSISDKIEKPDSYKLGYIHQCGELITSDILLI